MKKILRIVCILFSLPFIYLLIVAVVNWQDFLFPVIRYGEFPFHIEYKLNGEIFSIKDTVIAEFRGHTRSTKGLPIRSWRGTMQSGESPRRDIFHDTDVPSVLTEGQHNMGIWIWISTGWPDHFMGDSNRTFRDHPRIVLSEQFSWMRGSVITSTEITAEQLQEYFDITIVTWEFSEPIQNRFWIR